MKLFQRLLIALTCLPLHSSIASSLIPFPFLNFFSSQKELTCSKIPKIVDTFLRMHYSQINYNTSKPIPSQVLDRLIENYPKRLDPKKVLITKEMYDEYRSNKPLFSSWIAEANCENLIHHLSNQVIENIDRRIHWLSKLQPKEEWFEKTEIYQPNPDKRDWPSQVNLESEWLKAIKFDLMNLYDPQTKESWIDTARQIAQRQVIALKRTKKALEKEEGRYGFFSDAFASSLDPHSSFLTLEETNDFKMNFSLNLVGIGATLKQDLDGFVRVHDVIPGGAAARDGRLLKNDIVFAVKENESFVPIHNVDLRDAVQLIRGPENTKITLKIIRETKKGSKTFILTLIRTKIELDKQKAQSAHLPIQGRKIGIIKLPSFYVDYDGRISQSKNYRDSATDVAEEILKLKYEQVEGLILDLRGNSGGDLRSCIEIGGLFLGKRPIAQINTRYRGKEALYPNFYKRPLFTEPLVVLVDELSASSSEILAMAIQDWGRGLVVGSRRTFGKSTVQNVNEEAYGSIKVTIGAYYGPSGRSVQKRGVRSDVQIPNLLSALKIHESFHPYALTLGPIKAHHAYRPHKKEWVKENILALESKSFKRQKEIPEIQDRLNQIKKIKKASSDEMQVRLELKSSSSEISPIQEQDEDEGVSSQVDLESPDLKEASHILLDWMDLLDEQVTKSSRFLQDSTAI
jgi:carboxyl-terminal processing protease